MRIPSSIVFAAGTLITVLACSSSNDGAPAQASPEAGTSSSGGSSGATTDDGGGGSSGTTSSGGSSGTPDSGEVEYVKTTTVKIDVDGNERTYVLSVPLDYTAAKSYPLYIWLHGHPGSASAGQRIDRVTKNEAIIAYPGALTGYWDHGAAYSDNADTSFLFAMIDDIAAGYALDKGRILLGGWSGGGFMAGLVACRYYGSFKAIAIEAGGAPFDVNGGAQPTCDGASIATIVTHGGQDFTVGTDSGFYAAEYWEDHNGCNGTKAASGVPLCEDYGGCPASKPVRYCFDPNWGHGIFKNAHELEWSWFKALP